MSHLNNSADRRKLRSGVAWFGALVMLCSILPTTTSALAAPTAADFTDTSEEMTTSEAEEASPSTTSNNGTESAQLDGSTEGPPVFQLPAETAAPQELDLNTAESSSDRSGAGEETYISTREFSSLNGSEPLAADSATRSGSPINLVTSPPDGSGGSTEQPSEFSTQDGTGQDVSKQTEELAEKTESGRGSKPSSGPRQTVPQVTGVKALPYTGDNGTFNGIAVNRIYLSWEPVEGATSYEWIREKKRDTNRMAIDPPTRSTAEPIRGLLNPENGRLYDNVALGFEEDERFDVQVRAKIDSTVGEWSEKIELDIPSDGPSTYTATPTHNTTTTPNRIEFDGLAVGKTDTATWGTVAKWEMLWTVSHHDPERGLTSGSIFHQNWFSEEDWEPASDDGIFRVVDDDFHVYYDDSFERYADLNFYFRALDSSDDPLYTYIQGDVAGEEVSPLEDTPGAKAPEGLQATSVPEGIRLFWDPIYFYNGLYRVPQTQSVRDGSTATKLEAYELGVEYRYKRTDDTSWGYDEYENFRGIPSGYRYAATPSRYIPVEYGGGGGTHLEDVDFPAEYVTKKNEGWIRVPAGTNEVLIATTSTKSVSSGREVRTLNELQDGVSYDFEVRGVGCGREPGDIDANLVEITSTDGNMIETSFGYTCDTVDSVTQVTFEACVSSDKPQWKYLFTLGDCGNHKVLPMDDGPTSSLSHTHESVEDQPDTGWTRHSCRVSGTGAMAGVECWGENTYGQLGNGTTLSTPSAVSVIDPDGTALQSATAVDTGTFHSCAVVGSGEVNCWGGNRWGQLGNGTKVTNSRAVTVGLKVGTSDLSGMAGVGAGAQHTCAWSASQVYCWGDNQRGQLGGATNTEYVSEAVRITGLSNIVGVGVGSYHTCVVVDSGAEVKCWGDNTYGQLGDGTTTNADEPVTVTGIPAGTTLAGITAGQSTTCAWEEDLAATDDGRVWCWGRGTSGQLGNGTTTNSGTPVALQSEGSGITGVSSVALGDTHGCLIDSANRVRCWGDDGYGQVSATVGGGANTSQAGGALTPSTTTMASILLGSFHSCATDNAGATSCWGLDSHGQLGSGVRNRWSATPTRVTAITGATDLALGLGHSCAVVAAGAVNCWGFGNDGQLGLAENRSSISPQAVGQPSGTSLANIDKISAASGGSHTCAMTTGTEPDIYCWGDNTFGQLGDGGTAATSRAIEVTDLPSGSKVLEVGAGQRTSCALIEQDPMDNTKTGLLNDVWCWGDNSLQQINYWDRTNPATSQVRLPLEPDQTPHQSYPSPLLIPHNAGGTTVRLRERIKDEATSVFEGPKSLGLGDTHVCTVGQHILDEDADSVNQANAGQAYTAFRDRELTLHADDGHIYCWGDQFGGLADWVGSAKAPQRVLGEEDQWYDLSYEDTSTSSKIDALNMGNTYRGTFRTITPRTCSEEDLDDCDDDSITDQDERVIFTPNARKVISRDVSTATQVVGGQGHSCALAGGEVFCWGYGSEGQLGRDQEEHSFTTIQVARFGDDDPPDLTGVTKLTAGRKHTCAIVGTDRQVFCWGENSYGQLGTKTDNLAYGWAVRVPGLAGVTDIEAGANHTCAIVGTEGQVHCWGDNGWGQTGQTAVSKGITAVVSDSPTNRAPRINGYDSGIPISLTHWETDYLGLLLSEDPLFVDPDGDTLTYSIGSEDPSLVNPSINSNNTIVLYGQGFPENVDADQLHRVRLVLTATDVDGESVDLILLVDLRERERYFEFPLRRFEIQQDSSYSLKMPKIFGREGCEVAGVHIYPGETQTSAENTNYAYTDHDNNAADGTANDNSLVLYQGRNTANDQAYYGFMSGVIQTTFIDRSNRERTKWLKYVDPDPFLRYYTSTFDGSSFILSGTPTSQGEYSDNLTPPTTGIIISSEDYEWGCSILSGLSISNSEGFRLIVEGASHLTFGTFNDVLTLTVGENYTKTLPEAVGGTGTKTYSIQNLNLSEYGLSFNPNTRVLSGAPTKPLLRNWNTDATREGGERDTKYRVQAGSTIEEIPLWIQILPAPVDLEPNEKIGDLSAENMQDGSYQILPLEGIYRDIETPDYDVTSADTAIVTASLLTNPPRIILDAKALGTTTITLTATQEGFMDTQTFTVNVVNNDRANYLNIGDPVLNIGETRTLMGARDLYFTDPGDNLTLSARSDNEAVVTVSVPAVPDPTGRTATVPGADVVITAIAVGTANITLTVTDSKDQTVMAEFQVKVNNPPEFAAPDKQILATTAPNNTYFLDLSTAVTDADINTTLTFSNEMSSDTAVATVDRNETDLTVTAVALGVATISFDVTDGVLAAPITYSFMVEVNDPPTATGTIAEQTLSAGQSTDAIDITGNFADDDTLTYRVASSDTARVTATVTDGTDLTVNGVTATMTGSPVTITVTATDTAMQTATRVFMVTVQADVGVQFAPIGGVGLPGVYGPIPVIAGVAVDEEVAAFATPGGVAQIGNREKTIAPDPALPTGLELEIDETSNRLKLTGTTTVTGDTTHTVTITDADGDSAMLTLAIEVEADTLPQLPDDPANAIDWQRGIMETNDYAITNGNTPFECDVTPELPAGLSASAAEASGSPVCRIVGTPTTDNPGLTPVSYTLTVTDKNGDMDTLMFSAAVVPPDVELDIESTSAPTTGAYKWVVDNEVSEVVSEFVDMSGTRLVGNPPYTTTGLPAGLEFTVNEMNQLVVNGTPTSVAAEMAYTATLTDRDGDNDTITITAEIEADVQPSWGSATQDDRTVVIGEAVSIQLPTVTGGNEPITYSLEGNLPGGLALNPTTATITGTTTATSGMEALTIVATDANDDEALNSPTFTLFIEEDIGLEFTDTSGGSFTTSVGAMHDVEVGTFITMGTVVQSGNGLQSDQVTITVPSLPSPLELVVEDGELLLRGTPTAELTQTSYTATLTDINNDTDDVTFMLTVGADVAVALDDTADTTFTWNVANPVSVTFTPTVGNEPYEFTIIPDLPDGLTLNPETGAITGTPTAATAQATYTLTVTDTDEDTDTLTLTITVELTDDLGVSFDDDSVMDQVWVAGTLLQNVVLASFADESGVVQQGNPPVTVTTDVAVPGVIFSVQGSVLTANGTPTMALPETDITFTATDGDNDPELGLASLGLPETDTVTVSITVLADLMPSWETETPDSTTVVIGDTVSIDLPDAPMLGNEPSVYSLAPDPLPGGLTYEPMTNQITGTPATGSESTTTLTLTITDRDGDTVDAPTFDLVIEADIGVEFTTETTGSTETYTWVQDHPVDQVIGTYAEDGSMVIQSGNGRVTSDLTEETNITLPTGLSLSTVGSELKVTGTPTAVSNSTTYTVTVTDSNDDSATFDFTASVDADTEPTLPADPSETLTWFLTEELTPAVSFPATGGNAPLTYSIADSSGTPLPAWLELDPDTGEITGMPDVEIPATTPITLVYTVTDFDGDTDDLTFMLTVIMRPPDTDVDLEQTTAPPSHPGPMDGSGPGSADGSGPGGGMSGSARHYSLAQNATVDVVLSPYASLNGVAQKGDDPLTYEFDTPLPAGLTVTTDGDNLKLTGTPTALAALASYVVTVTDSDETDPDSDTITVRLEVVADSSPMFQDTTTDLTVTEQQPSDIFFVPLQPGMGNPLFTYTVSPTLPTGLRINTDTGVISGSPDGPAAAATSYTITVTDQDGDTDTVIIMITIEGEKLVDLTADVVPAPMNGVDRNFAWLTGDTIDEVLSEFGEVNSITQSGDEPLTLTITPVIPGLELSVTGNQLKITGSPTAAQPVTAHAVTVTDQDGDSDTLTLRVAITLDLLPTFGEATAGPFAYIDGLAITTVDLPEATSGNTPLTYSLSPTLPNGLTFTAGIPSQISGTPNGISNFRYYTLVATDADRDRASLNFTVVVDVDRTPEFGTLPSVTPNWREDRAIEDFSFPLVAVGNRPYTYTISPPLPSGLTLDAETGVISGTPAEGTATTTTVSYTLTVTDFNDDTDTVDFMVDIGSDVGIILSEGVAPPQEQGVDQNFTWAVGNPVNQILSGFNTTNGVSQQGDPDLSYMVSPNPVPGLELAISSGNLVITGVPTETAALALYTVTITDADEDTAILLLWAVIEEDSQPSYASEDPAEYTLVMGAAADQTMPSPTGGNGEIAYQLTPDTLPSGLSFNDETAQLTGTPDMLVDPTNFVLVATDEDGDTDALPVSIAVATDTDPEFGAGPTGTTTWNDGQEIPELSVDLTENTGNPPFTYSIDPALPAGVSLDTGTGVISGTPTAVTASATYTLTVNDLDGDTDTVDIIAEVVTPNRPPACTGTLADLVIAHGTATSDVDLAGLTCTDPDGDSITYSAVSLDEAVATVSVTNTTLTVTRVAVGSVSIEVFASDVNGGTSDPNHFAVNNTPAAVALAFDGTQELTTDSEALGLAVGNPITPGWLQLPLPMGGTLPYTISFTPDLPTGVTLDPATGYLVGEPEVVIGSMPTTYEVSDSDGDDNTTISFMFTFPVISANADPTVSATNICITQTCADSDGTGESLTDTFMLTAGQRQVFYDIAEVFSDPEMYPLAISVADPMVNWLENTYIDDGNLIVEVKEQFDASDMNFDAFTVLVTATDPADATATLTLNLQVTNQGLQEGEPLPDRLTVDVGGSITVNLSRVFIDPEGLPIDFNPRSGNNANVDESEVDGIWTIMGVAESTGTVMTVRAEDSEESSSQTTVIVDVVASGANNPPQNVGRDDIATYPEAGTVSVNLDDIFDDPDGDTLTYSGAMSSDPTVATVISTGSTLTITVLAAGQTTISVGATDMPTMPASSSRGILDLGKIDPADRKFVRQNGGGDPADDTANTVTSEFAVVVSNTPPQLTQVPAAVELMEGAQNRSIMLDTVFTDGESDDLTCAATSADDEIVEAAVEACTLVLNAQKYGQTTVELSATDATGSGMTTTYDLAVTVTNVSPTATTPIPDPVMVVTGEQTDPVDLAEYVTDPGGTEHLTYRLAGITHTDTEGMARTESTVSATIANRMLTLNGAIPGSATLNITASDGLANVQLSVPVTVVVDLTPSFATEKMERSTATETDPISWRVGEMVTPETGDWTAEGGNFDLSYSVMPALPAGLELGAETGLITGAPTTASDTDEDGNPVAGNYVVTAADRDGDTVEIAFQAVVLVASGAPSFTQTSTDCSFDIAVAGSCEIDPASGADVPITYGISPTLPTGLLLQVPDANTQTLSITGTATQLWTERTYTLTATDSDGDTDTTEVALEVVPVDVAPDFGNRTTGPFTWLIGDDLKVSLPKATSGNTPLTYTLKPTPDGDTCEAGTTSIPDGLTFDQYNAVVTGAPTTEAATASYQLNVTDADGSTDCLEFELTIEMDTTPSFAASSPLSSVRNFDVGVPTETLLTYVTGGNGQLTFSVEPALPAGLLLDSSSGRIHGSPTQTSPRDGLDRAVTTTYTLTVTDADGSNATLEFHAAVQAPPAGDTAPAFAERSQEIVVNIHNTLNFPLQLPVVGTNGNLPVTYELLPPTLPDGLTFDADMVQIGGVPTTPAPTRDYYLQATDADGDTDLFLIRLSVIRRPFFAVAGQEPTPFTATANTVITPPIELPTAAAGGNTLIYELYQCTEDGNCVAARPPGVTLDTSTDPPTLSGRPTTAGVYRLVYRASDAMNPAEFADLQVEITIRPAGGGGTTIFVPGPSGPPPPSGQQPDEPSEPAPEFTDVAGNTHEAFITQLATRGITRGCNPPANTRYCPGRAVTRAEMATFMTRAFALPTTSNTPFDDTSGNVHRNNINSLADAGISRGCNPPANTRYCPDRAVTRAEMATFLTRALGLTQEAGEFTDTSGSVHATNIQRLAAAGITRGCNPPVNSRFCPDRAVTRAEMATFLIRAIALTE